MSIWGSLPAIGFDDWPDEDESSPRGGQVRSYATGWSNHYPTTDGTVEREACIHLAHIPAWCAGGSEHDFVSVGPWLRLCVRSEAHDYMHPENVTGAADASVVMDEAAVKVLARQLAEWLQTPKVQP